uniref:Uncharacterized protein n=1 Tax=Candidatus Kentrum sp. MB TaxID=2138164 RepID=A0A450XUW1_9GAMM|nr:MAG: hypothetical protein BECKMB1821G_GA0114241_11374 [Candidatus Kentron sp. MB]VFK35856.1 MAG: hypothetical protein BECKMB1821I_GA0114274_11534 [Candidatus Kentron sp. MB]VFK77511.1 MAG: hypothetical protein BECKMB1821H_GA0114242_11514 [Candidatus Kentron sp. MB]
MNPEIEAYLQRSEQSINAAQDLLRGEYYERMASQTHHLRNRDSQLHR